MSNCHICFPQILAPTPTSKKGKCPKCIVLPNMVVSPENSVYPCGETGFIPFEGSGIELGLCGNETVQYLIHSHSNTVTNVSINDQGITFTSTNEAAQIKVANIKYIVTCGKYSAMGSIDIIFKSRCLNVFCGEEKKCDPCTGECEDKLSDLDVNKTPPSPFNPQWI